MTTTERQLTGERTDLLESLAKHRHFLRYTLRDLTDEQAARRSTASELCLGGLVKHVVWAERRWLAFVTDGPAVFGQWSEEAWAAHTAQFEMAEGETVAEILAEYDRVAARTDEIVATLPDLDASHPLPERPWFDAGASWSARRVLLHIIAETAQHAGHADIIREAIDGAKSMG